MWLPRRVSFTGLWSPPCASSPCLSSFPHQLLLCRRLLDQSLGKGQAFLEFLSDPGLALGLPLPHLPLCSSSNSEGKTLEQSGAGEKIELEGPAWGLHQKLCYAFVFFWDLQRAERSQLNLTVKMIKKKSKTVHLTVYQTM